MKKLTTSEVINKFMQIHGDIYDYSKFIYDGKNTKGIIVCSKHGEFLQDSNHHMGRKQGCPFCKGGVKINKEEFIERTNKIYPYEEYDYSEFVYINAITTGIISCKKHGKFEQTPNKILSGHGCPKCGINIRSNKIRGNLDTFIKNANMIHSNTYDYKKFIYYSAATKGIIICKKHGEFKQHPNHHLSGKGCPVCMESKGEKRIRNFLITNKIEFEPQKTFPDCRNNRRLRFDFYIPKLNLIIEYDGEQHFTVVNFNGVSKIRAEEIYKKTKKIDKIKNKYCEENNIDMLRIPYHKFNDIEFILKEKLTNV